MLLTLGYGTSLAQAAVVLSAAPLAWGLISPIAVRLAQRYGETVFPVLGLSVAAAGLAVLAVMLLLAPAFPAALTAWTVGGIGVGLAYPALYVMATTAGTSGLGAAELATGHHR
jgi:MFS family permease